MKEKIDNLVERAKQGPTLLRAGVADSWMLVK